MKVISHRLRATDPTERGREYGRAARTEIQQAIGRYLAHFRALGLSESVLADAGVAAVDSLRDWRPAAARELVATAGTAEVSVAELALLAARTEVLALTNSAPDECSAMAAAPPSGPAWSMQTWDWIPTLAPTGLLVEFPGAVRTVRTFTEPGMPAKIGVNTDGLGLQFNILHHTSDGKSPTGGHVGVGVHSIARAVLDDATTLSEAYAVATSAPVSASSVFTVVASGPDGAEVGCLEITPAGVELLPAEDGFIAHTNHLLAEPLVSGERTVSTTTTDRLAHLHSQRSDLVNSNSFAERAAAACGDLGDGAPICVTADPAVPELEQGATLLTIGTDPAAGALDWSVGRPAQLGTQPGGRFPAPRP